MAKNADVEGDKLTVTVELSDPLKTLLLRQCEMEDRSMASMVRVICKRYFSEQMFAAESRPQPKKDKFGDVPYYPDEVPESRQG